MIRLVLFLKILIISILLNGCEPIVNKFNAAETGKMYVATNLNPASSVKDTIVVMTWNIRFGAARLPWFGDSCGERVILTDGEVNKNLQAIADNILVVDPDILLLQEVDRCSKRSGYEDQVRWLLENTNLNYAVYASVWDVQFIPSDGLGRMDTGNVIMSRWEIAESERLQLPLRGDQDALTRYFYLRRNILKARIAIPHQEEFYVVNVHTAAFSTDDTKRNHINRFKETLDELKNSGAFFVAGGDLNTLPPRSVTTDYCLIDKCRGESFHNVGDDPLHKEGSYFTEEQDWLTPLYDSYNSAIDLTEYQFDNSTYFTHSVGTDTVWNRKLDYLFTNGAWVSGMSSTHAAARHLSDHAPVTAAFVLP